MSLQLVHDPKHISFKNICPESQQQVKIEDPIGSSVLACKYLKAYIALLKGTGRLFQNESLDITPNQFRKGQTLFVFDLSKNGIESETFEINENGSLTVNVTLKANIGHSIVWYVI